MRPKSAATTAACRRGLVVGVIALLTAAPLAAAPEQETSLAFRVGKVVTMDDDDRVLNNAVVLVRDGKIEAMGRAKKLDIPSGYRVIHQPTLWLTPGLVDAHNHSAGGGSDLHDYVYLTNPGYRTLESVALDTPNLERACAGGVTTVLLIPGSGNNMSGFGTVVRTAGESVEDAVIKRYGSIKVAQAGNPESYFFGRRQTGRTFMNYNTRQTFEKALRYHQAWQEYEAGKAKEAPEYDPVFHEFRGLFERRFVASVHTQSYQVLMTTVDMLAKKLGLRTVLDHCTFDAYKVAPLVKEDPSIVVINGPRQLFLDRTQRKIFGNAARWSGGGIEKLGINTDAGVIPQEELSYQAAIACFYGWKPYDALKGVTRVPAEALMLDDLGVIAPGKEASFGLWTGDPIDPRSSCELTVIRGRIVYDAEVKRVF